MTSILKFLLSIIVFIAAGYITLFLIGVFLNILAWIVIVPGYALALFLCYGIALAISIQITRWLIKIIFK
jgi:hypothetical protein